MKLHQFDTLDSTNAQARRMIASGEIAEDACLIARQQTAGRGTNGRSWVSPRDAGLYMSLVLFDVAADGRSMPWITTACGVACAEVLRQEFTIDVRVKPINDLMLNGGKLGGILTEASIEDGRSAWLIVGVGINLRRTQLGDVAQPNGPAFVETEVGDIESVDLAAFAGTIAARVAETIRRIDANSDGTPPPEWRALMTEDC